MISDKNMWYLIKMCEKNLVKKLLITWFMLHEKSMKIKIIDIKIYVWDIYEKNL